MLDKNRTIKYTNNMKKTKREIRKILIRRAVKLSKAGATVREIANLLPRSRTTIACYIKKAGQKLDKKNNKC